QREGRPLDLPRNGSAPAAVVVSGGRQARRRSAGAGRRRFRRPRLPRGRTVSVMKRIWIPILALLAIATLEAREPTHRLFVTNEEDNTVTVIDSRTNEIEATVEVGGRPRGIGFSPDHTKVYVALGDDNAIGVIDTQTLKVLKKIPSGSDPEA